MFFQTTAYTLLRHVMYRFTSTEVRRLAALSGISVEALLAVAVAAVNAVRRISPSPMSPARLRQRNQYYRPLRRRGVDPGQRP